MDKAVLCNFVPIVQGSFLTFDWRQWQLHLKASPQPVIVLTRHLWKSQQLPWSLEALHFLQYDTEDLDPKHQLNYVLKEWVISQEMDSPNLLEQSNKHLSARAFEGTALSPFRWGCNQSCGMDPAEMCEGLSDSGWLAEKRRMSWLLEVWMDGTTLPCRASLNNRPCC